MTVTDEKNVYECSICDQLWFGKNLTKVTQKHVQVIVDWHVLKNKPLSTDEIETIRM